MNLSVFQSRFLALKQRGFVRTLRNGPTGIGYTLETLLELSENNLAAPDIANIEIKAHRDGSGSLITLFTFNKKAWVMPPLLAIEKYGSYDKNNRKGLYYTMSRTPNSAGLFLTVTDDTIAVKHISGDTVAVWHLSSLIERFQQKIPSLLFISAHVEMRDDVEYFHFYRAQLMQHSSADLLKNLFVAEDLLLDLRLHDKGTRARNHGTGFRIQESKLPRLFNKIEDVA